jgi:peptide/nickel transport system substrate-binding protein
MPFAYPVPAETPAEDQRRRPLPATGPYMVVDAGPEGIELARNPEFREWSAAAQPDGFVDTISWRFREDVEDSFGRLDANELDVMIGTPAPQDLATLRSTHPEQVVGWPSPFTLFVGFDVVKPPFDDERVRQALNFAIDRDHVVDLLGGSTIQRPTCQLLPPNFQGYQPFCPYTIEPDSGVWSAPDPDRAEALIDDAGAAGEQVTVAVTEAGGLPSGAVEVMEYVTDVLDELGLRAKLEIAHGNNAYFQSIYPPAGGVPGTPAGTPRHPHVYMTGWLPDYPAAGNFIEPQFACGERGYG